MAARLGLPLSPVLPVRLCPLPGPLYALLMGYKESPVDEARRRFGPLVRDLLGSFLAIHAMCVAALAGGPIDFVLAVPSTARPDGPPLAAVAGLGAAVQSALDGAQWSPQLLGRTSPVAVGHMRPDARAFAPTPSLASAMRGSRALLVDDTYVSGARAQSASAALRLAGAVAVVIVPVGRVLRPGRSVLHAAFLQAQRTELDGVGETPSACARCVQTPAPAPAPASTE